MTILKRMLRRRRPRLRYLLLGIVIGFASIESGQAALNLELTQGVAHRIPVALISYADVSRAVLSADEQTLALVIKNDLQNSGQIRVDACQEQFLVSKPVAIDYTHWRYQKINVVIHIVTTVLHSGQYRVTVMLANVFPDQSAQHKPIWFKRVFTTSLHGQRILAHHISDLIYQQLTGIRGIFSTKIAYILIQAAFHDHKKYSLQVADADGFNPQTLFISHEPIMSLAWSPDAKKIAYVSFEGKQAAIYVQTLATGERERVSAVPGINGAPSFSPDGKSLAMVLTKPDNPKIYLLNLSTKKLRPITMNHSSIDTEPVWSPNGRFLFFTSDRDGSPQIYKCRLKPGSITTRVTYQGNYNAHPSFSADGRFVVMMHRENGEFGIAAQDLKTGAVHLLAQNDADESPSVAPNGQMVIYATEYAHRPILSQVSLDGRVSIRLPAPEGAVREPAWSPFIKLN